MSKVHHLLYMLCIAVIIVLALAWPHIRPVPQTPQPDDMLHCGDAIVDTWREEGPWELNTVTVDTSVTRENNEYKLVQNGETVWYATEDYRIIRKGDDPRLPQVTCGSYYGSRLIHMHFMYIDPASFEQWKEPPDYSRARAHDFAPSTNSAVEWQCSFVDEEKPDTTVQCQATVEFHSSILDKDVVIDGNTVYVVTTIPQTCSWSESDWFHSSSGTKDCSVREINELQGGKVQEVLEEARAQAGDLVRMTHVVWKNLTNEDYAGGFSPSLGGYWEVVAP